MSVAFFKDPIMDSHHFRVESKGPWGQVTRPYDMQTDTSPSWFAPLVVPSTLTPWFAQSSCTSSITSATISHPDDCSRLCAHISLPSCSHSSPVQRHMDQIGRENFCSPGSRDAARLQVLGGMSRTLGCRWHPPSLYLPCQAQFWHVTGTVSTSWGWLCSEMLPADRGGQALRTSWNLKQSWSLWLSSPWRVIVPL